MAGKRGGKWKQSVRYGGGGRLERTVKTGCGAVRVYIDCHASGACYGGQIIGPGKMRQPLPLKRYPRGPLGHVVSHREAMHVGDRVINEIRLRCGTRPRRVRRAGPLGRRR